MRSLCTQVTPPFIRVDSSVSVCILLGVKCVTRVLDKASVVETNGRRRFPELSKNSRRSYLHDDVAGGILISLGRQHSTRNRLAESCQIPSLDYSASDFVRRVQF